MKKTQKLVILALTILASTISLKAQDQAVLFGVKGGFNYSNFTANLKGDLEDINSKIGFNIGATVDFAFSERIYLLTGLELTTKGYSGTKLGQDISANAMYINLPLHLGYKYQSDIYDPVLVVRFGPYIGYGVGGKTTWKGQKDGDLKYDTFSSEGLKKFDAGLGAAVGIEIQKVAIDLGYNYGLLNISESSERINAHNLYINVGYKFKSE